jgi:hypothetical protein
MTTNININQTKYWFQEPIEIFNLEKYNKLLPLNNDKYPEKINSFVRLSIVVGVIAALINLNIVFIFIPLTTMLMTYLVYVGKKKQLEQERFNSAISLQKNKDNPFLNINTPESSILSNEKINELEKQLGEEQCTPPVRDNIFMNPLPYDDRNRYPACDYTEDKTIKSKIEAMFDILPHDADNIFNRNDGRYGFHTMPSTTFPNDRDEFAKWVYGRGISCKEGNGEQCYNNMYHGLHAKLGQGGNAV